MKLFWPPGLVALLLIFAFASPLALAASPTPKVVVSQDTVIAGTLEILDVDPWISPQANLLRYHDMMTCRADRLDNFTCMSYESDLYDHGQERRTLSEFTPLLCFSADDQDTFDYKLTNDTSDMYDCRRNATLGCESRRRTILKCPQFGIGHREFGANGMTGSLLKRPC